MGESRQSDATERARAQGGDTRSPQVLEHHGGWNRHPPARPRNSLLRGSGCGCTARGSYATQVAVTQAETYERAPIKRKVQDLFDSLGGIGDVLKGGNRVAIKINPTGGSGSAFSPKFQGVPITESMCTHPGVLRAVGELVVDCGAEASGRNPRVR